MLRLLGENDLDTVKQLTCDSLLGARIRCYALCYGFDKSFIDFWAGDSVIVARFENVFTVKADESVCYEELREFLDVIGADDIVTDELTAISLGFNDFDTKNGFVYVGDSFYSYDVKPLDDSFLPELYDVISEAIPNSFSKDKNAYLSFLSDYMYRSSRGFSRAYGICISDKLVSTVITSSETDESAIISGVACLERYRSFGYGKKTVLTLSSVLKNENKKVYVIALNESAEGFYKHIDFEHCCRIAYISKKV